MSIIFAKESLTIVRKDINSLLDLNYAELTLNKQSIKLNPDWEKYAKLESDGKLTIFTARNDTELVGYSFFFIDTHIHYKDLLVATNDVLFLHKDYRKGVTGIKFLKFCDSNLNYVDKIVWHVKDSNDFKPILYRMGYSNEDTILGKLI
jgi:hypothetical protein